MIWSDEAKASSGLQSQEEEEEEKEEKKKKKKKKVCENAPKVTNPCPCNCWNVLKLSSLPWQVPQRLPKFYFLVDLKVFDTWD
jgi:hypothetical protein